MRVLVVREHAVRVVAGVPELPKGELGHTGVHVLACELARVSLHVVEAPPVKPDVLAHPPHPLLEALAHALLGVVDVGSGPVLLARGRRAAARPLGVVGGDVRLVPCQPAAELVPLPVLLTRRAPMVDDDVRYRLDVLLAHLAQQSLELHLRAELGVEVVKVQRQVALQGHALGGGRQPDGGVPGSGELIQSVQQVLIPYLAVHAMARLPVEALENDFVALSAGRPCPELGLRELGGRRRHSHCGPHRSLGGDLRARLAALQTPTPSISVHTSSAPEAGCRGPPTC
mmetsp:Transcript_20377/g.39014  ORF Transcript_20377/g.39014 Transcript_20377/m.39014 type:complete len:286 (-) Transcript_20377:1603-2460(-)